MPSARRKHYAPAHASHAYAWQDWAGKIVLLALFVGCLALIALSKTEDAPLAQVRQEIAGATAPLSAVAGAPAQLAARSSSRVGMAWEMLTGNSPLLDDHAALQQWRQRAEKLEAENKSLRRLLKEVPTLQTTALTARVLGNVAGPYSQQVQIAAGSADGIQEQMAAVNEQGLVGRVLSIQNHTAQLMAVTDVNFRVAVVSGKSREHAVVKGLGKSRPGLFYLPNDSQLQVGERLYTSGDGGLMPPDILVGRVAAIHGSSIEVIPAVDFARLHFVRLLAPRE